MPSRPANVNGSLKDLVHVVNQSVREINQRIDVSNQQISRTVYNAKLGFQKGVTIGGGSILAKAIKQVTSLSFGSISAQSSSAQTLTVKGALQGTGTVFVSPLASLGNTNLTWSAWVSAPNTVEVRVSNPTTGAITPNTVNWSVWVHQ